MDGTREKALAFYANSSEEFKREAQKFFNGMDTNGDGNISKKEFKKYVTKTYKQFKAKKLFKELDEDGDGCLNLKEVVVFFYMACCECFMCGCCENVPEPGTKFYACRECFVKKKSYNLCQNCYDKKDFTHKHPDFISSHEMLPYFQSEMRIRSGSQISQPFAEGFIGGATEAFIGGAMAGCSIM